MSKMALLLAGVTSAAIACRTPRVIGQPSDGDTPIDIIADQSPEARAAAFSALAAAMPGTVVVKDGPSFLLRTRGSPDRRTTWQALHLLAASGLVAVPAEQTEEPLDDAQGDWPLGSSGIHLACPDCGPRERWGAGQTLCQLDTGYVENDYFDKSRVHLEKGLNFVERSGLPLDPGGSGGGIAARLVGLHYHGTGAASVIVASKDGLGIAPGAEFVPLRISDGFVGFAGYRLPILTHNDERQLADGLEAVATRGSHSGPETCDVASIAQGGVLPYAPLWKGLRAALSSGVIVVAAAGQIPFWKFASILRGPVAFPARYSATGFPIVAVDAVEPDGRPWAQAFRGAAADISAPGTAIPHVEFKAGAAHLAPGKGTTFATGLTAGAALLWLQHHGGRENILKHYGDSLGATPAPRAAVPCAFRLSVRRSVRESSALRAQGFGFGILDVERLLATELPPPSVVAQCLKDFDAAFATQQSTLKYTSNDRNAWESSSEALPTVKTESHLDEELVRRQLMASAELADIFARGCSDTASLCSATLRAGAFERCGSPQLAKSMLDESVAGPVLAKTCGGNANAQ